MDNKDYFEYIKDKSFAERLRAFGEACESVVRNSANSSNFAINNESRKYYSAECRSQGERVEFLFKNLLDDYERKQKISKEYLDEEYIRSSYYEGSDEQLDFYIEKNCDTGSLAYLYSHADHEIKKMKVTKIIWRSECPSMYDNLIPSDDDVLIDEFDEREYDADTSAEFTTINDACIVWFAFLPL